MSDWAPGTTLLPKLVNITFNAVTGAVNHVGIGYDIIGPSGAFLVSRGWTWDGGSPTSDLTTAMNSVLQGLVGDLLAFEGVAIAGPAPHFA
jgi:hypothetical protein